MPSKKITAALKRLNSFKTRGVNTAFDRNASAEDKLAEANATGFGRSATADGFSFGQSDTIRTPLLYVDPLFDPILMLFPKDNIRELNRRLRHYYQYDEYVRNIIDLHSTYSLSDFQLRCEGCKEAEDYYNDFKDRMGLLDEIIMWWKDYWILGETVAYTNWDLAENEISEFVQFPPEEVEIHKTYMSNNSIYVIKPNEDLRKTLSSNKSTDKAISDIISQENPEFYEKMKGGKPYVLKNERVIHLANRPNKYTRHGISPLLACVKDLLYQDKLRLLLLTFVDRHTSPIKIFKLGSKDLGWIPSPQQLLEFQSQLVQASSDPDYNIITHPFVEVDYVVGKDKIMDLLPHFEWLQKRLMVGLFVGDGILHGDATYAGQAISLKILLHRYLTLRQQTERELQQKVFLLLAMAKKFVIRSKADVSHGVRTTSKLGIKYYLPSFFWQKMNLLANQHAQELMVKLRDKGDVPFKYIADLFNWDIKSVEAQLKDEESTRFDPLWREIRKKKADEDEKIQNQILDGVKTEDLKITVKEADEIKEAPKKGVPPMESGVGLGEDLGFGAPPAAPPPPPEFELPAVEPGAEEGLVAPAPAPVGGEGEKIV